MAYIKGSVVDDQDYDSLIDKYNTAFASTGGIGLAKKAEGEIVTRNDWFNLWQKVFDTATAQNRIATLPFHASAPGENPFSDQIARNYGYLISALPTWGSIGDPPAPVTVGFLASNYSAREPAAPASATGAGSTDVTYPPGTPTITIPPYDVLRISVSGGGGASNIGQGNNQSDRIADAAPGAASSIAALNLIGAGGAGGPGALNLTYDVYCTPMWNVDVPRPGGLGQGGQFNGYRADIQSTDPNADPYSSTIGGAGAKGGIGWQSRCPTKGATLPSDIHRGSDGSAAGLAVRVWTRGEPGAPAPGTVIPVSVGAGGAGKNGAAPADLTADRPGGYNGANGYIRVEGIVANPAQFVEKFSGGAHSFVVPSYTTMRVTLSGGGGGGANNFLATPYVYQGKPGGDSSFLGLRAAGGALGSTIAQDPFSSYPVSQPPPAGAPASGGDSNATGGGGRGGAGTGFGQYEDNTLQNSYSAGQGGNGGKTIKVWNVTDAGAPQPGQTIALTVGFGGDGGWRECAKSPEANRAVNQNATNSYGVISLETYAKLGGGYDGEEGFATVEGTLTAGPVVVDPNVPAPTSVMVFKIGLDKSSNQEVRVNYATSDLPSRPSSIANFSQDFLTPGTYNYAIPDYTRFRIQVSGGGGGSGYSYDSQSPFGNGGFANPGGPPDRIGYFGEQSTAVGLTAYGGLGGNPYYQGYPSASYNPNHPAYHTGYNPAESDGVDENGDRTWPQQQPPPGGDAVGGQNNVRGGGARGGADHTYNFTRLDGSTIRSGLIGGGTAAGLAVSEWGRGDGGAPAPNSTITIVVGAGGKTPGEAYYRSAGNNARADAENGAHGFVKITGTMGVAASTGVATAGVDYTPVSGTLVFAPGETYKEVGVNILYDTIAEPDELFQMTLSSPVNTKIGTGSATGTILGATVTTPTTTPPPPPPPPVDVPGKWKGYYLPRPDLPGSGRFFGQQSWQWEGTATHPTPDLPFPNGFTEQGQFCQSDGNCQGGSMCPCTGLMSYGNPYEGAPVLTCFPGKRC